jgi:hypothetical protein
MKNHDGATLGYCLECGLVKYVASWDWIDGRDSPYAIKRCRCTKRIPRNHKPVPAAYCDEAGKVYNGPQVIPETERKRQ